MSKYQVKILKRVDDMGFYVEFKVPFGYKWHYFNYKGRGIFDSVEQAEEYFEQWINPIPEPEPEIVKEYSVKVKK